MKPLEYRVAVDPIRVGESEVWLVLQQSTDFEGWVVVAKAKTHDEAQSFATAMEQMEQEFFAAQRKQGRA
ncbi:MAG: hypothetical protein OEY69_00045 [Candidatus Krumholzibacteria bacterium]|nr:hypothetical protein [Candidatus Krumholzibacteria bacterium]